MKGWGAAIVGCVVAALSFGCSHRFLSLFLDGVPPPKSSVPAEGRGPAGPATTASGPPGAGLEHGPYAAKLCDSCHATKAANSLVAPANQLCERCHEFVLDKAYVHGPLASGGCLVCHDPHASRYPHLLVSEAGGFCLHCHDRRDIEAVGAHEGVGGQCTDCHEAHMSDKKHLLR